MNVNYLKVLFETLNAYCALIESGNGELLYSSGRGGKA